jgi:hypothetical protein
MKKRMLVAISEVIEDEGNVFKPGEVAYEIDRDTILDYFQRLGLSGYDELDEELHRLSDRLHVYYQKFVLDEIQRQQMGIKEVGEVKIDEG